jgi:hypothetical protein
MDDLLNDVAWSGYDDLLEVLIALDLLIGLAQRELDRDAF